MTVNLIDGTLSYKVNNNDYGVAWNIDKNIKYTFGVYLRCKQETTCCLWFYS